MDVVARLPDGGGQAADAVSAYTRVKIGGRSQIAKKIPKSECPNVWTRLPQY